MLEKFNLIKQSILGRINILFILSWAIFALIYIFEFFGNLNSLKLHTNISFNEFLFFLITLGALSINKDSKIKFSKKASILILLLILLVTGINSFLYFNEINNYPNYVFSTYK